MSTSVMNERSDGLPPLAWALMTAFSPLLVVSFVLGVVSPMFLVVVSESSFALLQLHLAATATVLFWASRHVGKVNAKVSRVCLVAGVVLGTLPAVVVTLMLVVVRETAAIDPSVLCP